MDRTEFMGRFASVKPGMGIYSRDGENLGRVRSLDEDGITIEKGFFFPKDFLVQYGDIVGVRGDQVILNRGRMDLNAWRDAKFKGWTEHDQEQTREKSSTPVAEKSNERRLRREEKELNIPLLEEELDVQKSEHEAGVVRVRKVVRTEVKQFDVPLRYEDIRVERTPASKERTAKVGEAEFKEEIITILLMEEKAELVRRPVVKEEVKITKTMETEHHGLKGETRKEDLLVDDKEFRATHQTKKKAA